MSARKPFSKPSRARSLNNSFQKKHSPQGPLKQLLSSSKEGRIQENPFRLLFRSGQGEKQKESSAKTFKRTDYSRGKSWSDSFQRGYSSQGPLKQLLFTSKEGRTQENPFHLLLRSRQGKSQKKSSAKVFKRDDYREWLDKNSKDLSSVFSHRLSKRQIIEKGMGFLPPKTGTGYVKKEHIKKAREELEKKYRDKTFFKERASIKKDLEIVKRYEQKLKKS